MYDGDMSADDGVDLDLDLLSDADQEPELSFEEPGLVMDPASIGDPAIVGDPTGDALHWHEQDADNSCAVAAQEFVLDDFTGVDHSEAELREVAEANGWYTAEGGTPMNDVGNLLEHYGIDTEQHHGASLQDLESALAAGDGVIVGVDSGEIWNPDTAPDDALTEFYGIPGQGADHAVQVTGIDRSDPDDPQVILNDSGSPDGQGERVPLETFMGAWEDSSNFLVVAHRP